MADGRDIADFVSFVRACRDGRVVAAEFDGMKCQLDLSAPVAVEPPISDAEQKKISRQAAGRCRCGHLLRRHTDTDPRECKEANCPIETCNPSLEEREGLLE